MRRDQVSSASFADEVQSEFAGYQHNSRVFCRGADALSQEQTSMPAPLAA